MARIITWVIAISFALIAAPAVGEVKLFATRLLTDGSARQHLVADVSAPVAFRLYTQPAGNGKPFRAVLELMGVKPVSTLRYPDTHNNTLLLNVRGAPLSDERGVRVIMDARAPMAVKGFVLPPAGLLGHRVMVALEPVAAHPSVALDDAMVRHAPELADGSYGGGAIQTFALPDDVRVPHDVRVPVEPTRVPAQRSASHQGVIIALDAGHGGIDPGAIGKAGTREKTVTLAISRYLAELINAEAGMRAVLIRDGDNYLKLRERIDLARAHQADVFVSIHADASKDSSAMRGASVYILSSRGASSEAAKWLAEKENSVDLLGSGASVTLHDKDDVLASVLLDLSQTGTLEASAHLADLLLNELGAVGKLSQKSVQQAAFLVLRSPDIPSVLVETAFLSNTADEQKLRDPGFQRKVAAALFAGIHKYVSQYAQR